MTQNDRPAAGSKRVTALRGAVIALAALVLVGGVYGGWAYYIADRSVGPMLIVGRRGDVAKWPENTLQGIRSAARLPADGIEFDVRQSADGTFYLMHDPRVDRTTGGTGFIRDLHDREIDTLVVDGGLGFHGQSGIKVPRLTDVLQELEGYDGEVFLDAKGNADEHAELARLIAARGVAVRIGCYSRDDVAAVSGLLPTYGGRSIGADDEILESPLPWWAWVRPPEISAIHERWTDDETDAADRARRWGVKFYITNDLASVLTLQRSQRQGVWSSGTQ